MEFEVLLPDGTVSGPFSMERLAEMIRVGELGRQARLRDPSTGAERLAGDVPELAEAFAPQATFGIFQPGPVAPPQVNPYAPPIPPPPASRGSFPTWLIVAIGAVILLCTGGLGAVGYFAYRLGEEEQVWNDEAWTEDTPEEKASIRTVERVARAMLLYAQDHDDVLPVMLSDKVAVNLFVEPYMAGDNTMQTLNPAGGTIVGNPLLAGKSLSLIRDPFWAPLVWESTPWPAHGAILVGAADGSYSWEVPEELQDRLANVLDLEDEPLFEVSRP